MTRSAYADTDALFEPPEHADVRVTGEGTPQFWAERIAALVRPVSDPRTIVVEDLRERGLRQHS